MDLVEKLFQGEQLAAARLISIIENNPELSKKYMPAVYKRAENVHILGITGPPGVGKSTLINSIIGYLRNQNLKVGVLAIDPSSSYTNGAFLGDRIRLYQVALGNDLFFRSMASRGQQGGLSLAALDAAKVIGALGMDVVIVETVGVGQSELDIKQIADSVVLVMMPESGDTMQVLKAGIMEAADIFVVNKCDLKGAPALVAEIEYFLHSNSEEGKWTPAVCMTNAVTGEGIDKLWENAKKHLFYTQTSTSSKAAKLNKITNELAMRVTHQVNVELSNYLNCQDVMKDIAQKVMENQLNPYEAADELTENFLYT